MAPVNNKITLFKEIIVEELRILKREMVDVVSEWKQVKLFNVNCGWEVVNALHIQLVRKFTAKLTVTKIMRCMRLTL
jgi:hypothetical protein